MIHQVNVDKKLTLPCLVQKEKLQKKGDWGQGVESRLPFSSCY